MGVTYNIHNLLLVLFNKKGFITYLRNELEFVSDNVYTLEFKVNSLNIIFVSQQSYYINDIIGIPFNMRDPFPTHDYK